MLRTSESAPIAHAVARVGADRFWIAFNDAWRGVTRKEIGWTLAIGLMFTVAQAFTYASAGRNWPLLVRPWEWVQVPSCLLFLVAFRMAEHPQLSAIPQWLRYAIVIPPAASLYFLISVWIWAISLSGKSLAAHDLPMHEMWVASHALLLSIIAAIVYASLMRSRRAQAAFDTAALQRARTARRVTAARLATLQAQVDPTFLFSTLELVETLYERDPDAAERTLAELIDFLRTALPKLPAVMNSTDHKASSAQHAAIDLAEAVLLQARVGEEFEAAVLDVGGTRHRHNGNAPSNAGTVAVDDPPVRARCEGTLPLGERIPVRLITADPARRLVVFSVVDAVE